jgi:hypothetical protein
MSSLRGCFDRRTGSWTWSCGLQSFWLSSRRRLCWCWLSRSWRFAGLFHTVGLQGRQHQVKCLLDVCTASVSDCLCSRHHRVLQASLALWCGLATGCEQEAFQRLQDVAKPLQKALNQIYCGRWPPAHSRQLSKLGSLTVWWIFLPAGCHQESSRHAMASKRAQEGSVFGVWDMRMHWPTVSSSLPRQNQHRKAAAGPSEAARPHVHIMHMPEPLRPVITSSNRTQQKQHPGILQHADTLASTVSTLRHDLPNNMTVPGSGGARARCPDTSNLGCINTLQDWTSKPQQHDL